MVISDTPPPQKNPIFLKQFSTNVVPLFGSKFHFNTQITSTHPWYSRNWCLRYGSLTLFCIIFYKSKLNQDHSTSHIFFKITLPIIHQIYKTFKIPEHDVNRTWKNLTYTLSLSDGDLLAHTWFLLHKI